MNEFIQNESGILGSPDALRNLATLEEATILVISDSHKNVENFKKVLNEFKGKIDAIIFCGDGAYDFGGLLDLAFSQKSEKDLIPPVCAYVRGNGDPSYISCDFPPHILDIPEKTVLEVGGKKIFISHGHCQSVYYNDSVIINEAKENGCNIILHGHTHIARNGYIDNGMKIICPGSISLPRGGQEKSFCILTIKGNYSDACFISLTGDGFKSYTPL